MMEIERLRFTELSPSRIEAVPDPHPKFQIPGTLSPEAAAVVEGSRSSYRAERGPDLGGDGAIVLGQGHVRRDGFALGRALDRPEHAGRDGSTRGSFGGGGGER
jgi:hypothetical protein